MSKIRSSDQGMVSIITVLLLSLVLLVMTTGFLRLMVRSNRQVADAQLSSQAFYAAETGLEDAKKALDDASFKTAHPDGTKKDCAPFTNFASGTLNPTLAPGVEYTCQLIDSTPKMLSYDIGNAESILAQARTTNPLGFDAIRITWSKNQQIGGANLTPLAAGTPINVLPQSPNWGDHLPMLRIELMVVQKNDSNQLTRDQFYRNERSYFVSPETGTYSHATVAGVIPVTFCPFKADNTDSSPTLNCSLDTQFNDGVKPASCDNATNKCSVTLELHAPHGGGGPGATLGDGETIQWGDKGVTGAQAITDDFNARLRIRSIYKPAHVDIELLKGGASGSTENTKDGQVNLDVTARAQDVYRRIHATLPILPPDNIFPDYTVEVAEDICKLFRVVPPATVTDGGCGNNADNKPNY